MPRRKGKWRFWRRLNRILRKNYKADRVLSIRARYVLICGEEYDRNCRCDGQQYSENMVNPARIVVMSSGRMIAGALISLAAAFVGCTIGLAMSGYGICAVSFSVGLVGFAAAIGVLFGGAIALVWRQA